MSFPSSGIVAMVDYPKEIRDGMARDPHELPRYIEKEPDPSRRDGGIVMGFSGLGGGIPCFVGALSKSGIVGQHELGRVGTALS